MFFLVRNDDGDAVVLGLVLVLVGVAATKEASVCKWVFNVLLFHLQINACSLPYTTLCGEGRETLVWRMEFGVFITSSWCHASEFAGCG